MIFVCLFIFGAFSSYSQDDKEKVAVRKFSYTDDNAGLAKLAEDRIAAMLHNSGRVKVVERDQLDMVLEEQRLSQSGLVAEEDEINFGNLVGANFIITGGISNVGYSTRTKRYTDSNGKTSYTDVESGTVGLNLKMIDVASGDVIFSKAYNAKGSSDIFVIQLPVVGREPFITKLLEGEISKNVMKDIFNFFPIKGAILFIDGKKSITIDIGSKHDIKKDAIVEITSTEKRTNTAGRTMTTVKTIAKLQVLKVTGEESSVCKIIEGSIEDLEEGTPVVFKSGLKK